MRDPDIPSPQQRPIRRGGVVQSIAAAAITLPVPVLAGLGVRGPRLPAIAGLPASLWLVIGGIIMLCLLLCSDSDRPGRGAP